MLGEAGSFVQDMDVDKYGSQKSAQYTCKPRLVTISAYIHEHSCF